MSSIPTYNTMLFNKALHAPLSAPPPTCKVWFKWKSSKSYDLDEKEFCAKIDTT